MLPRTLRTRSLCVSHERVISVGVVGLAASENTPAPYGTPTSSGCRTGHHRSGWSRCHGPVTRTYSGYLTQSMPVFGHLSSLQTCQKWQLSFGGFWRCISRHSKMLEVLVRLTVAIFQSSSVHVSGRSRCQLILPMRYIQLTFELQSREPTLITCRAIRISNLYDRALSVLS